jgi:drug/metabolite transporter (DMT)-like permease
MFPIVLALVAFLGWGVADVANIVVARRTTPITGTYWNLLGRAFLYTLLLPFFIKNLQGLDITTLLIMLATGFSSAIGYLFFMKGAKSTNPSIVIAIIGAWGALSAIESVLFLGERVNINQLLGILVIFFGFFLVTFDIKGIKQIHIIRNRGIWLGFAGMLAWSICGTFIKIPIQKIGWFWPSYFLSLPFSLGILLFDRKKLTNTLPIKSKTYFPFILCVILTVIAEVSYNISIGVAIIPIIAAISGSYAVLTVVLSFFLFKQHLTKQQLAGIITTLCGIVYLSIVSI